MAVCTCKGERASELLVYKLGNGGLKTVVDFIESAAVFALSKMWWDLLSAFVFGLHSVPYCTTEEHDGFVATECYGDASANTQFLYALATIPITGLIKHLAESSGLTALGCFYRSVRSSNDFKAALIGGPKTRVDPTFKAMLMPDNGPSAADKECEDDH